MGKTIRPAPDGKGTYSELDGDNTFDGTQTGDAWTTPKPTVKGHPDTQSTRDSDDVPIIEYAPEHITESVYRPIVALKVDKTASYNILVTEAYNFIFTNTGATGSITFTLPVAAVGMEIMFYSNAAQDLVIDPNGTDQIMSTDTAGDTITSDATVGSHIVLRCLNANTWSVMSSQGTWTEEV